jgi:thiosulfate reductase cytochrome b subunit
MSTTSNTELVLVYKGFERFWHWAQSFLIIFLAITGFEIHSSYSLFGFEAAVNLHNKAAWGLIILVIFAIFWHITTGEWKQYLPTSRNLKAQVEFYLTGIFRNAPHPTKKTVISKLNPLQRLVYLGLKILVIPVMVLSGLAYYFYRYPQAGKIKSANMQDLEVIALVHTLGAFLLVTFIIAHIYLITTGHTVTSNLKAMITGWEELEKDETEPSTETKSSNQ